MKTKPWQHQLEDLNATWKLPAAALPWEPRCGKSKVAIDTAERLYNDGWIDAAVIIAPNGVHLNWTRQELPIHSDLPGAMVVEWDSSRSGTQRLQRQLQEALEVDDRFVWVTVNVEALGASHKLVNTKRGSVQRGWLERFVRRKRCLLIVDESHKIKNPRAARTKAVLRLGPLCPYRRTLTGTPTTQGPFDLWSQYELLDPEVFGCRFTAFRTRYGVFRRMKYGAGPAFDELVGYKNLDNLRHRIAPITFPRVKSEVLPWLPERIHTRRYFVLPPDHRRVYEQVRTDLIARLDAGQRITASTAVTQLLRLQQISRGHATTAEGEEVALPGPTPAAEAVLDLVAENGGKVIVWTRFVADARLLQAALEADPDFAKAGQKVLRCDGSVPPRDRPDLIRQFWDDPRAKVWVGTLATGGEGIDLSCADLMIFYSHGFDLAQRLQGLERNYGSRQTASRVDVVDLVAADTVDLRALDRLAEKEDLATSLTGEALRDLLT